MKTKREHIFAAFSPRHNLRPRERGNALIYVLIAIALFAALGFTLSRQTDTSEARALSRENAELYASQMISYAAQARSAIDQMLFTAASSVDQLDFTPPSAGTFDTGTLIHKVYHPQGGGLNPGTLPAAVIAQSSSDPVAGWYLGRFTNVDWTASSSEDVILTAYQISEQMCGIINEKITGSSTIPSVSVGLNTILIDETLHSGTNVELTTDAAEICPECNNIGSLCIRNGNIFAFYTILADQ